MLSSGAVKIEGGYNSASAERSLLQRLVTRTEKGAVCNTKSVKRYPVILVVNFELPGFMSCKTKSNPGTVAKYRLQFIRLLTAA